MLLIDSDENAMMKPSVVVESQRDGSQFHIIRDIKWQEKLLHWKPTIRPKDIVANLGAATLIYFDLVELVYITGLIDVTDDNHIVHDENPIYVDSATHCWIMSLSLGKKLLISKTYKLDHFIDVMEQLMQLEESLHLQTIN